MGAGSGDYLVGETPDSWRWVQDGPLDESLYSTPDEICGELELAEQVFYPDEDVGDTIGAFDRAWFCRPMTQEEVNAYYEGKIDELEDDLEQAEGTAKAMGELAATLITVSYTHLRAHET